MRKSESGRIQLRINPRRRGSEPTSSRIRGKLSFGQAVGARLAVNICDFGRERSLVYFNGSERGKEREREEPTSKRYMREGVTVVRGLTEERDKRPRTERPALTPRSLFRDTRPSGTVKTQFICGPTKAIVTAHEPMLFTIGN